MIARALLGALLFLAACDRSEPAPEYDMGIPIHGAIAYCPGLSDCVAICAQAHDPAGCEADCRSRSTMTARTLYDAVTSCVARTCDVIGDAGTALCADASSLECMRCRTNSQQRTPAECTDAPSYCGACSAERQACDHDSDLHPG